MKKLISLAIVLFLAVAAAAQNLESQKITQTVVEGKLEQTVFAGENIETIRILYENTGFGENDVPEYSSTDFYENFGLSKSWTKGPICEISGQMRKDIAAGTYNAYIVVKDDEGNLAKTEFKFIVKEKPIPSISLELSGRSGEADLIVLSVIGPENQASAKASIEVIPATMTIIPASSQARASAPAVLPISWLLEPLRLLS